MTVGELVATLETIAPTHAAEPWDNVGLLVGDRAAGVSHALLTIDYTPAVAAEAKQLGVDFVIAYHPPIFKPISAITSNSSALVFDAIRRGMAIYSPHTALDVAPGGTNDVLADLLVMQNRRPLRASEPKQTHFKLVTFVPRDKADALAEALFAAGAGDIGDYSKCSFRLNGTGTFFGSESTNPVVGTKGNLERVDETRIEVVVPMRQIPDVVAALKSHHPYEEPAFDVYPLSTISPGGIGRIGDIPDGATAEMLINLLKRELQIEKVLVAGELDRVVRRAAVCAGSCGQLLDEAIRNKVDFYLTGEMRHHDALRGANAGVTVVCTLHSNSERVTLTRLAERLRTQSPAVRFSVSQVDRDPLAIV